MNTKAEWDLFSKLADRALDMELRHGVGRHWNDKLHVMMDLDAVHQRTPLRLVGLLAADDGDFAHDVFGIAAYVDRGDEQPGALRDCFLPRYAVQ